MDAELQQYLAAVLVLLSINAGYLATLVLVSGESMSLTFLVVPPAIVAAIVGAIAWLVADVVT